MSNKLYSTEASLIISLMIGLLYLELNRAIHFLIPGVVILFQIGKILRSKVKPATMLLPINYR